MSILGCSQGNFSSKKQIVLFNSVSIQLVSPARGEPKQSPEKAYLRETVFPFNWFPLREGNCICVLLTEHTGVSIQLVSPARGELAENKSSCDAYDRFPFNWFPLREGNCNSVRWEGDRLLMFPFNWFPLREGNETIAPVETIGSCFHSIGFPCERGTCDRQTADRDSFDRFPFNWFPLREGNCQRS